MSFDIKSLYDSLGVPFEDSSNQEVAPPADDEIEDSSKNLEVAEPEDDEEEPEDEIESEEEEPEQPKQSSEENKKYQAARKKAEFEAEAKIAEIQKKAEEAIAAEKARADAIVQKVEPKVEPNVDKFYADRNMTNPYRNDLPIKTEADYNQFLDDEAVAQANEGNFAPLLKLLRETKPQVDVEKIKRDAEQKAQEKANIERMIERDMAEIARQDPEITLTGNLQKDYETITARPYGAALVENQKKNMTLLNAFYVGAKDFLVEREKERTLAAVKHKKAGTSHMKSPTGRGTKQEYVIPPETRTYYQAFFKGVSEKEMQEMYAKDQDREGG